MVYSCFQPPILNWNFQLKMVQKSGSRSTDRDTRPALGNLYWSEVGQQYEYAAFDQQRSADDWETNFAVQSLRLWGFNIEVEDIFCSLRRVEGDAQAENIANAAQPEAKSILAILIILF
jgi:hypothetical protein